MLGQLIPLFLALGLAPQVESPQDESEAVQDHIQFLRSIDVPAGATAGEAVCILCSIRVDGALTSEAVAIWGSVTVSGSVAGEVVAVGGDVHLLPGSRVGDEIVAVAGRVNRAADAAVSAEVESIPYLYFAGQPSFPWPGTAIFAALALVLLLTAAGSLPPRRLQCLAESLRRHPFKLLLVGGVAVVLFGLLDSATTLLGPAEDWVDLVLLAALLGSAWLGAACVVGLLGRLVTNARGGTIFAGAILLVLLLMVPLLGLLVMTLVFLLGLGAAWLTGAGSSPDWLAQRLRRSSGPSGQVVEHQ